MRWQVVGVKREDASEVSMVIAADRRETAEGIAQLGGVLVESCTPLSVGVLPYAGVRRVEPPPMVGVNVKLVTSRPWVPLMWVGGVVAFLAVLFIVLSMVVGAAIGLPGAAVVPFLVLLALAVMAAGIVIFFLGLASWAFRA